VNGKGSESQFQQFGQKTEGTVETTQTPYTNPFAGRWITATTPMTPKQYTDAIDRLGLSQRAAGAFLGVDERTSRRWVSGDSAIPESVAKLLRLMIRLKIKPEDV
jgi:DNA-binding transcriptional regulator YiaG